MIRTKTFSILQYDNDHKLLIDGDMLLYRASWATEGKNYWEAIASFNYMLGDIIMSLNSDDYILYISSSTNFRTEVYPDYKANRKDKPKPLNFTKLKDYIFERYKDKLVISEGLEADDLIADNSVMGETICVSGDKDLLQIPGWYWNFIKKELTWMGYDEARLFLNKQILTGDAVDNIPGIKGIGPVGASVLLDGLSYHQQECIIMDVYTEVFQEQGIYWSLVNEYLLYVGTGHRRKILELAMENYHL